MKKAAWLLVSMVLFMVAVPVLACAANDPSDAGLAGIRLVQQYNFSIHILAMLLVGFAFVFVFLRNYGYGAATATYIVVAAGLPLYMLIRSIGCISAEPVASNTIKSLLLAEFAVASALIAMGVILGRIRIYQYAILAAVFIPAYMVNEWLVLDGALGFTKGFMDAAGSVVLHAFGAYFGIGMSLVISNEHHRSAPVDSDTTSDRFSMLGSMMFWLFWPSFCCALVPFSQFEQTAINTVLALCGATLTTFVLSAILRKGKIAVGDMANAVLAGGVSIGATCNVVTEWQALFIGACAGILSVTGFAIVQPYLLKKFKILDSAGIHNLHGMPGLLGGLAAVAAVPSVAKAQLSGIVVTVVLAFVTGLAGGFILKATGAKKELYQDKEEFSVPA
jgi:ammonium transporter Rh